MKNKNTHFVSFVIVSIALCVFCVCFGAFYFIYLNEAENTCFVTFDLLNNTLNSSSDFVESLLSICADNAQIIQSLSVVFQIWYFLLFLYYLCKKNKIKKTPLMPLLAQSSSSLTMKYMTQYTIIKEQFKTHKNIFVCFHGIVLLMLETLFFSLLLLLFLFCYFLDEKVTEVRGFTLFFSLVGFFTGLPLVLAFLTMSVISFFLLYINWLACKKMPSYEQLIYDFLSHDCVEFLVGNSPGGVKAAKELSKTVLPYAVGAFGSVVGIVLIEDATRDQMARHEAKVEIESTKQTGETPRPYSEMRKDYRDPSISRILLRKASDLGKDILTPPK